MKSFTQQSASRLALLGGVVLLGGALAWPLLGSAQDKQPPDPAKHRHAEPKAPDKDLAAQLHDLRAKLARLEAALKKGHQDQTAGDSGAAGMGGMSMGKDRKKKPGMGMMDHMSMGGMAGMGGKKGGTAGPMGVGMMDMDMMEMMGMMGVGKMGEQGTKGMGKMRMAAALPGFPGASHIYHVGATGFFLDHPEHVQLTAKQQGDLNRIKEKALLAKSTAQRKIDEAEQELWELTASDRPEAVKVEAKVREIERLRGDQRLAFIRSVGTAAKVLTDEQRQALLGADADKPDTPGAHSGH